MLNYTCLCVHVYFHTFTDTHASLIWCVKQMCVCWQAENFYKGIQKNFVSCYQPFAHKHTHVCSIYIYAQLHTYTHQRLFVCTLKFKENREIKSEVKGTSFLFYTHCVKIKTLSFLLLKQIKNFVFVICFVIFVVVVCSLLYVNVFAYTDLYEKKTL